MFNVLIAKFLRTFFTSLVIYISRKLVFYLDQLFTDFIKSQADVEHITCGNCGETLRVDILKKISSEDKCPKCLSSLLSQEKI